jgi:hypothetical protein
MMCLGWRRTDAVNNSPSPWQLRRCRDFRERKQKPVTKITEQRQARTMLEQLDDQRCTLEGRANR